MTKKVLILDDDPLIRSTLEQALKLQNIEAQSAGEGKTGLEITANWQPDLILLDHHMPGMTGIEFLQQLRANSSLSNIEVIYLTSDSDISHINEAIALGVKTYLNKSEVQIGDITKVITDQLK